MLFKLTRANRLHSFRRGLAVCGLIIVALGVLLASPPSSSDDVRLLPADHASLPGEKRCVDCHAAHHVSVGEWVRAWFAKVDMTSRCLNCHNFAGPSLAPHNRLFPDLTNARAITCTMCHSEHKGFAADIKHVAAAQCNVCHRNTVASFVEGHPQFESSFPHGERTAINYDHVSHIEQHFKNPKFATLAPQGCSSCHSIAAKSQRHVGTLAFEQACGACHEHQIIGKDLVLFRVPAMTENPVDPSRVRAACGESASAKLLAGGTGSQFEGISDQEPTEIMAYLLGVAADDPEAYQQPMSELLIGMAEEGVTPIAELIDNRAGKSQWRKLLAGLPRDVLRPAACAWVTNQEYASGDTPENGGWYADSLELRYKPMESKDPVIKAWIEFALNANAHKKDDERGQHPAGMLSALLSTTQGAGRCAKCHALTTVKSEGEKPRKLMEWNYHGAAHRPYTFFDHGIHLDVLPEDRACGSCHLLNPAADYAAAFKTSDDTVFASNFKRIVKETCLECHGAETSGMAKKELRKDCSLCHTYHLRPTLRREAS